MAKSTHLHNSDDKPTEFIIIEKESDQLVKSVTPYELTLIDAEAMIWDNEQDADEARDLLEENQVGTFKVGRPGDRQN